VHCAHVLDHRAEVGEGHRHPLVCAGDGGASSRGPSSCAQVATCWPKGAAPAGAASAATIVALAANSVRRFIRVSFQFAVGMSASSRFGSTYIERVGASQ
jgi:hypothetical protein